MANPSPKLTGYKNTIDADGHMIEPPDASETARRKLLGDSCARVYNL